SSRRAPPRIQGPPENSAALLGLPTGLSFIPRALPWAIVSCPPWGGRIPAALSGLPNWSVVHPRALPWTVVSCPFGAEEEVASLSANGAPHGSPGQRPGSNAPPTRSPERAADTPHKPPLDGDIRSNVSNTKSRGNRARYPH